MNVAVYVHEVSHVPLARSVFLPQRFAPLTVRVVSNIPRDGCGEDAKADGFCAAHQAEAVLQASQRGARSDRDLFNQIVEMENEGLGGDAEGADRPSAASC